ncbi:MAG: hypothetical protein JWN14_3826 [Chthonomonadales bacterium]|nr:hypothetical protein [Chthonomonadales bacterium]
MNETAPPAYTGFEVKLEYSPLAFIYGLFPVFVVINGTTIPAQWGTQFYPAVPGRYHLACYMNYLITKQAGINVVAVDLSPGQVIRVTWKAPHVVFMKGPMRWEVIAGPQAGYGSESR